MLDTGGEGALSTQVELDVYAFHLIGREVFETSIQLVGVQTTARTLGVDEVLLRTRLLSANLILLPMISLLAFRVWGPPGAKLSFVLLETVFDQAFIMVAVLLQLEAEQELSSATAFGALDFWEQIQTNLPTIVPAVLFVTADQVSSPSCNTYY